MPASLFNRIKADEIADRLDGEYYSRELLENEDKLGRFNQVTLESSVTNARNAISDLTSNGSFEFLRGIQFNDRSGIPYIRTQNLMEGYIDGSDVIYVDLKCKEMVAKSLCETGDLVVCRKGKVGAASAVSVEMNGAAISENVTRFRLQDNYDGDFLAAFLNSNHGRMRFLREATGVIQKWINNEKLRQIKVIRIEPQAEKYIGDKVRQAEQLRAWAKAVQQQAAELLPAYINEIQRHEAESYRAKDIIPERLDSLFYHPDYIALERKMKAKGCNRLGLVAKQIKDSWNKKKAETFEYYEIGGLDITTGQVLSTKTQTVGAPSRAKTKVQQGDVLVSTVRPNRKNVGFIVDSETESEMVATSGFSVLRFSSLAQAAFYHAWLRTDDATAQLMRWNSGSAYPAIDDDVPLNIIVPEFEQEFIDSWGQKLLNAQFAYVYARKLTEASKTLVEALIEGKLTEQQLIQAQQTLDDGDNSLDQAILSKLSSEGYGIEGATPLFSDLDELYRLLESAAQAEAEA